MLLISFAICVSCVVRYVTDVIVYLAGKACFKSILGGGALLPCTIEDVLWQMGTAGRNVRIGKMCVV